MQFFKGSGAAAMVVVGLACTHVRGTAASTAAVGRSNAPAAMLLVGADGTTTLDARRVSEADLERALQSVELSSPGRAVTVSGAAEARYGGVVRALELAALVAPGPITLAAPDLHPLTAFPAPTGAAGAHYARLVIDGDGRVWLDQSPVGDADLAARARDLLAASRPLTIVVAAERRVLYGRVSAAIDALRGAGVTDFLLATNAPEVPAPEAGAGDPPLASAPGSAAPAAQQAVVPPSELSAPPRIECDEDALRRFFPSAFAERGVSIVRVLLRVSVGADGAITDARAMEDPGFDLASAAERAMMASCRATVPRDRAGRQVATEVSFRLNFEVAQE